jgi:diguanylate cyclase (GGDEF)-like protein/PAS domain S-box-containing protein
MWSLSYFASQMLRADMERVLSEQQYSTVTMVAAQINREFDTRLTALDAFAGVCANRLPAGAPAMQALIEQRADLQALFNGVVAVYGADGKVVAHASILAGRRGIDDMDVEVVAAAIGDGRASIGRPRIGTGRPHPVIAMAVSIRDDAGRIIGALAGAINLGSRSFLDQVSDSRYGKSGGYLLVAPRHRLIVTATDRQRILEVLPGPGVSPLIDKYIAGAEGSAVLVNPRGVEMLVSVKNIPAVGWYLAAVLPTEEAFAPIRDMQRRMLLATLLMTVLAGGLTWWLLRRSLSPLMIAARILSARHQDGQSLSPLPVIRGDEIGQLVDGFNRLLALLLQREGALKESERKLSEILENVDAFIYLKDIHGHYLYANRPLRELLGATSEGIVGQGDEHFFDPATASRLRNNDRPVLERGEVLRTEDSIVSPRDGSTSTYLTVKLPLRDEAGRIYALCGIATNITERKTAEVALRASEQRFRDLLRSLPSVAVQGYAPDGTTLYWNEASERLYGYSAEEAIGRNLLDLIIPPAMRPAVREAIRDMFATGRPIPAGELGLMRKDGSRVDVFSSHAYVHVPGQSPEMFCVDIDLTERKRLEADQRIAAIAFESQEGMFITDADKVIVRVNQAFSSITGFSAEEAIGKTYRLLDSGRHDESFFAEVAESLREKHTWQGEIWGRRKSGEIFPQWLTINAVRDEAGTVSNFVATLTDITARKLAEDEIRHLAFYDPLTRLPNRRLLLDRLEQALVASSRHHREGALLYIDLDNFKNLNDTLGHDIGDLLLQQVAQRLVTCVREGDTVARLGGDEFVVMLEDLSEDMQEAATQTEAVGDKILGSLNQPYRLKDYEHHSTPSIGVTLFSDQRETVDELLKRADLAMYQAKAAGRNTLRFFNPEMQAVISNRAAMESDLAEAVLERQFVLHFQPQVSDEFGVTSVIGAEVLVRWDHPRRGLVAPSEFISLAEDSGLVLPLGEWVLKSVCAQLAKWATRQETAHLVLSVNVSARQFHQAHFVDQVLAALGSSGASPERLRLELTEDLLACNVEDIVARVSELKAKGVRFALDDFGTGYSSLSCLKRLPLDQVKIDRAFVRDMLVDSNDAAIARMIIALADSLGISVLAEGVETEEQRAFLALHGCHAFQGFLFGHPMRLEEFERHLKAA